MTTNTSHTIRFYLKHIKPYKWLLALMVTTMLGSIITSAIFPLIYKQIIDLALSATDSDKLTVATEMMQLLLYLILLEIPQNIFFRCNEYSNNYFQPGIMRNIGIECFEYLHHHSYRFFSNNFSGALVRKVNRLVSSFESVADKVYWNLLPIFCRVTVSLGILYWFSPTIAITIGVWTIIYIYTTYRYSKWRYSYEVEGRKWDSKLSAILADTIANNMNIQLFTAHEHENKNFRTAFDTWHKLTVSLWHYGSHRNAIQGISMAILNILVIWLFIRSWTDGVVTVGFFIVIQSYLNIIFENIWDVGRILQDFFKSFADAEEMIEILNTPHEVQNTPNAVELVTKGASITFKNVSFGYGQENILLKNFNLEIKAGEKVALVGHSGEGKTTITKLIMRFFDIQAGKILLDNQDISRVTVDSLRKSISLVPQEPVLFHRTLAENINYGKRTATKDEIIEAAKKANCHDFISKLKNGYDTFVGERGIKLSGGERQRVAIARAILENAPLVILDEATSSLDSHAEKLIQRALDNLLQNKTSIIIAHRLSTIMKANRILVIEGGQIVEDGTHFELLQKKDGVYKHLWDLQAGGFISE